MQEGSDERTPLKAASKDYTTKLVLQPSNGPRKKPHTVRELYSPGIKSRVQTFATKYFLG